MLKTDKSEEVKVGAAQGLAAMGPNARPALPALREMVQKLEKGKLEKAAKDAMRSINAKKG